jgi:hypothetical protein
MGVFNIFSPDPLTLNDLVNIDPGRQERAQYLNVELVKIYHQVKKESLWDKIKSAFSRNKATINMLYSILKFNVASNSGKNYIVLIELQPNVDFGAFMNNKVRVYCSCPSFKFQSAYYLNRRDNLYRSKAIDLELGPALTEAPKRVNAVSPICKHVFACINWINNNLGYLMQEL